MARVKCQIMARIVGYYRPVSNWNNGAKEQWNRRNFISFKKK